MSECHAVNPLLEGIFCRKNLPCWGSHVDYRLHVQWVGNGPMPVTRGSRSQQEKQAIKDATKPEIFTGPPDVEETRHRSPSQESE